MSKIQSNHPLPDEGHVRNRFGSDVFSVYRPQGGHPTAADASCILGHGDSTPAKDDLTIAQLARNAALAFNVTFRGSPPTLFDYSVGIKRAVIGHCRVPPSYVGYLPIRRNFKLEDVLQAHLASCPKVDSELREIELSIELSGAGTRRVFNGRRHWVTSLHPSRKAGRPIQCEGRNELLFARQMEVDYGVVDFRSQAIHFRILINGVWREYYADFVRLLADGTIEVVEVKPDPSYLDKADYREKIEAVAGVCRSLGWRFQVVYGADLRTDSVLNFHVSRFHAYSFHKIQGPLLSALRRFARNNLGDLTVEQLIAVCGDASRAKATLCALVCLGEAYVNLASPISNESLISFLEGGQA